MDDIGDTEPGAGSDDESARRTEPVAAPAVGGRFGRFVIVKPLGAGGMGSVYEARDPELARSVALKVLRERDPMLSMRLLREAQALAQLQHPNVVAVHALDLHEDQVFVAMELVDGETLDKFIERTRPDWRGIVGLFVQAGRGLAAAHAKGIVHRDVKPSNLLVDAAGRVRVGDFGLARHVDGGDSEDGRPAPRALGTGSGSAAQRARPVATPLETTGDNDTPAGPTGVTTDESAGTAPTAIAAAAAPGTSGQHAATPGLLASPLTHAGTVLGTPYFMAPEQHLGRRATPATDQFSFCVALWIALFDQHPFAIERGIQSAVVDGRRRPRPTKHKVPRWLIAALDRGLEMDPDDRHPSMVALVDLLVSRPARGRRVALAGAIGAAAVAAAAVAILTRSSGAAPPPVCDDGGLAQVWSPAARVGMASAFAKARPADGTTALRVAAALDAWRARWDGTRAAVCASPGGAAFDPQIQCLGRERTHLAATLETFAAANAATVDRGIDLVAGLPAPELCTDPDVVEELPLPDDPRVGEIERELKRARLHRRVGRRDEGRAIGKRAMQLAVDLGHPKLLAEARMELALGSNELDPDAQRKELELALADATKARSKSSQAWITIELLRMTNEGQNSAAIESMLPIARAAVADSPSRALQRDFALYEAHAFAMLDKFGPAMDACDRIAKYEIDPKTFSTSCRCSTLGHFGKLVEAKAACLIALDTRKELYGPDSVMLRDEYSNLALIHRQLGENEKGLEYRKLSMATTLRRYGPGSTELAGEHYGLALFYDRLDQPQEAKIELEKALALYTRGQARPTKSLANTYMMLARVQADLGDKPGAGAAADRALEVTEQVVGKDSGDLIAILVQHGQLQMDAGRTDLALVSFDRAVAIAEKKHGATHVYTGMAVVSRAQALLELERGADGLAAAKRALGIFEAAKQSVDPRQLFITHVVVARATAAAGDRARGLAELRRLREEAVAKKMKPSDLEMIDKTIARVQGR